MVKNNMYDIIAIGDAVVDTHIQIDDAELECKLDHSSCKLCFDYAAKIPISDSFQAVGGNAANMTIASKKLGLQSAVLTTLGSDSNGKLIIQELKNSKVDTKLITADKKGLTRYAIVLNFKGERTILSYHQKRKYSWPKTILPTDWIYYTSLSEGYESLQENVVTFLEKHPTVQLAFNPGSFQLKYSLNKVKEMMPHTDLLIVNLQEAETILGTTLAYEKSIVVIIHKLLALGAKEVALTDAGQGAYGGNYEEIWHLPSYPVEVVAKTGAGDAFSAGYLAGKINNELITACLQWGVANSCGVIQQVGAHKGLLNVAGIKKMITEYPKVRLQKMA